MSEDLKDRLRSCSPLNIELAKEALQRIEDLERERDWYRNNVVWGFYEKEEPAYYQGAEGEHEINEPVTAKLVNNMVTALNVYKRERDRFRHAHPEMTGEYFLAGGHGEADANMLPKYVRIVPAYGCAWEQLYERTDKTITYEGS